MIMDLLMDPLVPEVFDRIRRVEKNSKWLSPCRRRESGQELV